MADLVTIRRLVKEANDRDAGDDETRMARFQQKVKEFLTPDVFKVFGFTFTWSEGGARKHQPSAVADLGKTRVSLYEGTEGHQFIVSLMHKSTFGPRGRRLRYVDTKDEFLKMLQGWI